MDHPAAFYVTWHWGYVDSRHPERIYLTTARQPEGRLYYATWWELDLSAQPPAANIYSPLARSGVCEGISEAGTVLGMVKR